MELLHIHTKKGLTYGTIRPDVTEFGWAHNRQRLLI